ncbi:MAG: VOC family protein [Pseudonocardiaceae bacterium]
MAVARWRSVALDCADPTALAAFWAELVGGEIAFSSDEFVAVKTDRVWLAAVRISNYQPPSWPGGDVPKQMHLDLAVAATGAPAGMNPGRNATGHPDHVIADPTGCKQCGQAQRIVTARLPIWRNCSSRPEHRGRGLGRQMLAPAGLTWPPHLAAWNGGSYASGRTRQAVSSTRL